MSTVDIVMSVIFGMLLIPALILLSTLCYGAILEMLDEFTLKKEKKVKSTNYHFDRPDDPRDPTPQERIATLEDRVKRLTHRVENLEYNHSEGTRLLYEYLSVESTFTPSETRLVKIKKKAK